MAERVTSVSGGHKRWSVERPAMPDNAFDMDWHDATLLRSHLNASGRAAACPSRGAAVTAPFTQG